MRSLLTFAAAAVVALLLLPALAQAHAHLTSAEPADKATLKAAPSALVLHFSEEIELAVSKVTVTGPAKADIKTGALAHSKDSARTLEVPLPGPLAAGAYSVEWRVLSKDGHKVKGGMTFSIAP